MMKPFYKHCNQDKVINIREVGKLKIKMFKNLTKIFM